MRIAVLDDYQRVAAKVADWASLGEDVEVVYFHEPLGTVDDCAAVLTPFDAIVAMRERTQFPAELFEKLPQLQMLVVTGGGNNRAVDSDAAIRAGVRVEHTYTRRNDVVAHTWALIHAVTRHIVAECVNVRSGGWQSSLGLSLAGKQIGLVGFGKTGKPVGEIARHLGMRVVAWSPHLSSERLASSPWCGFVEEQELYKQSDIVSVHMVLAECTRGMIGAQQLGWMPATSIFINTSRGLLVDESALLAALVEGRIAGAGLDVFAQEPLPPDHPFRRLPNVVATPHIGYVTKEVYEEWYSAAVSSLRTWCRGDQQRDLT